MLKNYLKIAIRNLLKNRVYSFINVVGLAIGLACCIFIGLYVIDELSYDQFHENSDSLYRVIESYNSENRETWYASTYSALAPALKSEFPSIKHISHVYPTTGLVGGPNNIKYQEDGIIYADSSFFKMFDFHLIQGDSETALVRPLTMVITEDAAVKYFGDENPVGKTLTIVDQRTSADFEITGLAKNPPKNSHIQFDYVISYESLNRMRPWEYNKWYYPPMYTYVELNSSQDVGSLKAAFSAFQEKYVPEEAHLRELDLQPITDIRLYSELENELSPTSDIIYIYLFSAIGIFILVIACINFMNLATARSISRSREVGMRKTLGANRGQLIRQFLSEAFVLTFLSMLLAIFFVELFLPFFNSISGKELSTGMFNNWSTGVIFLGIVLVTGLLAGSYPAFYLSSFRPVRALKGSADLEGRSSAALRKGLVIFQFFVSCCLIFGTVVVTQQLDFLQNEKLGFNKEEVLIIPVRETQDQFNIKSLKNEILRVAGVQQAAGVSGVPGISSGIHAFSAVPDDNKQDTLSLMTITTDHDFLKTLELNIAAGRDFSEEYGTDEERAFIINQTAAQKMGWDDPIGKELTLRFYVQNLVEKKGTVVGMVEDFQYHSLHTSIDPILIQIFPNTFYHDYLAVRLGTDDIQQVLAGISEKWTAFNPERPFEYFFLDETFNAMYRSEQQLGMVFNSFAVIAIIIACLGLFGLASYSTEQRLKELGIRKVLGAGLSDLLSLLSRDFLTLVTTGFLISIPVAMYLMNRWLENFVHKISISFGIIFFVGVIAVAVAIIAVSYQSTKAALMNPVDSLRSE